MSGGEASGAEVSGATKVSPGRHSIEEYESALSLMRGIAGARVEQLDFIGADGAYRRAAVYVEAEHEVAGSFAQGLAVLAVQVRGYLTMFVQRRSCRVEVSVTRDLSPEEVGGLMASRVIEGVRP